MNLFDTLVDKAIHDEYLDELILKAEQNYSESFLKLEKTNVINQKDFFDLLRFADILCRSKNSVGRNKSYKIISLLFDDYKENPYFQTCANTVLTKLGIFPTLSLIEVNGDICINPEMMLERSVKETYQLSDLKNKIFTDAQYALFEKLKNTNHFSFSGPTSFGKSFIMEAFINHLIIDRNASDNIVILVPTRALINQVSSKLKNNINHKSYKILTYPIIPSMYKAQNYKYIFVFTPERWISYVTNSDNPIVTYMFIDEAQKIISNKDTRAPLYYHSILLAERKSINLFFASPNIPNSEIFLQLFEKSQDETMSIQDSPVAQNRYFFDFVDNKAILFSDTGKEMALKYNATLIKGFPSSLLIRLGTGFQNIVYCNTIEDTTEFSLKFSRNLPLKNSDKINEVVNLIKTFIHKDYYLIDCLKHGVAFHFGRLPQRIRLQVENLFSSGELDYIFCTSTLLEGVNLPAKNIFILNNAIGLSKFSDIDFWNLAGRAGRLSKELSGNIICVRAEKKRNRWDNPSKDLEIVRKKDIKKIYPVIISGESNFYKNLENAIEEKPFTRKNPSQNEIDSWNHYSNILCIHQISEKDSVLVNNFLKRNPDSTQILEKVSKRNKVPSYILEQSSTIKIKYQNDLWNSENISVLPREINLQSCQKILDILYDIYNWGVEESGGRNPMVRERSRLQYFSRLMFSWIEGKPLNMIINNLINYYKTKGKIFYQGKYVDFISNDKKHINIIINELMADIDNSLRFKIKSYLLNYSLICKARLSDEGSLKWVDYLEYGTTNPIVIGLQTLGIPRHLSNLIIENYTNCLDVEDGIIKNFNIEK